MQWRAPDGGARALWRVATRTLVLPLNASGLHAGSMPFFLCNTVAFL